MVWRIMLSALTKRGKQTVNARVRAIDKNLFEKSDGDIRALVVDIDARDLLRIVIDDADLRDQAECSDYSVLQEQSILEDAFEDNVRKYLRLRSKINRNIKETALSEEAYRFFYFNNGITITCSNFEFPKAIRSPVITLTNLQIVNGSQTIHALFEAFKENPDRFENMDVLCRIYETRNEQLSTSIAEYTNSQNPVKTRDIRSNDFIQKKLEKELEVFGYFYERKKGQHSDKPKNKRIDAEKTGQALWAFVNRKPGEAKDKKRLIFGEAYDEVFSDQVTADTILLVIALFNEIELRKAARKRQLLSEDISEYEEESFITHATYYVLFCLSLLSELDEVEPRHTEVDTILGYYERALNLLRDAIAEEKRNLGTRKDTYSHRGFFKSTKPQLIIEQLLGADGLVKS